jgi:hypothetical protein
MWIHRTMCDILHEMRECYKTRNFSSLLGLIEEAQSAGNRMEAAIGEVHDIADLNQRWHECKDKDKALDLLKDLEKKEKEAREGRE